MIDLKEFNPETEKPLYEAVLNFNEEFAKDSAIMTLGYYELYKRFKNRTSLTAIDWRNFYRDKRVQNFYNDELNMQLEVKIQKLSHSSDLSTSDNTTLTNLIKRKRDEEGINADDGKIFVYTFIPLTSEEENAENVKILSFVPKEIKGAIHVLEGNKNKK